MITSAQLLEAAEEHMVELREAGGHEPWLEQHGVHKDAPWDLTASLMPEIVSAADGKDVQSGLGNAFLGGLIIGMALEKKLSKGERE